MSNEQINTSLDYEKLRAYADRIHDQADSLVEQIELARCIASLKDVDTDELLEDVRCVLYGFRTEVIRAKYADRLEKQARCWDERPLDKRH